MRPTFGSLFAGIGGFDLGLERAGWECKWQVEIDDYCQKVLMKHWPDVPKFRDIKALTGDELEPVDLICGGFPCQDVSVAGKRKGITGERSGLWSDYVRLIRILRPRYVLVENVPGLLSAGFGRVLGDLAESGYDAEWASLFASQFGAPHHRERVFLLAHPQRKSTYQVRYVHRKYPTERIGTWAPDATRGTFEIGGKRYIRIPGDIRVDDGFSPFLDRCKSLGNAVVPQVAEAIGRMILENIK